jgi:hypothetical protein
MTETVLFNLNDPRLSPDEPWLPELLENVGVRHGLFLPLTVNHDLCYRPHRELGETPSDIR